MRIFSIVLASLVTLQNLSGLSLPQIDGPHRIQLGPEFYRLKRTREGGSRQTSWMYGLHYRYDRLKPCGGIYWGLDGMYAYGHAKGHTGTNSRIKSSISDLQVEGRLGYSFLFPYFNKLQVTPFAAYGFFNEYNEFKHPSPVHYHYRNQFTYAAWGIMNAYALSECFSVGLDVKGAYMLDGSSTVSHDREYDRIKLEIESEWQYEIDVPINYSTCLCNRELQVTITPFYRLRHYGGKPNYPFDFYETKFQIIGIRTLLDYYF